SVKPPASLNLKIMRSRALYLILSCYLLASPVGFAAANPASGAAGLAVSPGPGPAGDRTDVSRPKAFQPFRHAFTVQHDSNYARQLIVQPAALEKLDHLLSRSVEAGVFPGCQVYASRNGVVVYQKSFGRYTYDADAIPVNNATLYD